MSLRRRVAIDMTLCEGNALCVGAAPDVFAVDDETGLAELLVADVSPERLLAVEQAARLCPRNAIIVRTEPA